ncbi:MAG TPA: rod shape-determining protein MreD [Acidimicrobiia bacterium]|nr:rod shape-determining protein MreD [Acidimicrobiia bacterium]
MIRRIRLSLVVVMLVVIQTTVIPHLRVFDAGPDLVLLATIAVAYEEGPDTGAIFGFASGLTLDLFLATPLGCSALAFAVVGYLVGVFQGGMLRPSGWVAPVLGAVGGLAGNSLFVVVASIAGEDGLLNGHSVKIIVVASLYDAVLARLVFPIGRWAAHDPDALPR